jgi:hypothetical protein
MDVSEPVEITIENATYLMFKSNGYPNIRSTNDATNIRLHSNQELLIENGNKQMITFTYCSCDYNISTTKPKSFGKYIVTATDQGIEFFDRSLISKLKFKRDSYKYEVYYYNDINCFAVSRLDSNNSNPLTSFYDNDLKLLTERVGSVTGRNGSVVVMNNRFFDIKNLIESITYTIKKYDLEELCADINPITGAITYKLRRIIFSENECAICMMPLTVRWCVVPCGHTNICGPCLNELVKNKKPCSICRAVIKTTVELHV